MAILRQIAQLGNPVLRSVADRVVSPTDDYVQRLVDDLFATVADANGVGIAAPQVYESRALFIVASRPNLRYPRAPLMAPTAVINPEIIHCSEELESGWEGCLSIPGLRGLVPRNREISVRFQTLAGELCEEVYSGFLARVFQHEYDHLQGRLFIDRVSSSMDLMSEKEYLRMINEGDDGRKK